MGEEIAFILGYTGATGKALVLELVKDDYFKKIILVGRRKSDLPEGADDRCVQEAVDYDKIGEYSSVFKGCTVGYCCLGCSEITASKEVFNKIDRDYVLNTASVAKAAGCRHFHVITSINANKDSALHYRKVKGEAEHGLMQLGFDKLNIYRPGFLRSDTRQGRRYAMDVVYKCCCFPCLFCCKSTESIKVEDIARAMLYKTKNPPLENVQFLENRNIFECSK